MIQIIIHSQEEVLQKNQSINWGGCPDIKVKILSPELVFILTKIICMQAENDLFIL